MKSSELNPFTRVEQLFNDGELDNAYQTLIESIPFNELNSQQQQHYQFMQGLILLYQNRTEELINLGEEIFNEGQKQKDDIQAIDGLFFILAAKITGFLLGNDVFIKFEKADAFLKIIKCFPKKDIIRRESRLDLLKAMTYLMTGDLDLVDKHLKRLIYLEKELSNTFEKVWIYILLARRMLQGEIQHNLVMEYTRKALTLAKDIKFNHFWIALCYVGIGAVNYAIGELDLSLRYSRKALMIYTQINNKWYLAAILNNIGNLYTEKGEYDKAIKYLEEGLLLWEQDLPTIETGLDSIISVALKKGDGELARKYFIQLENLYHQKKNPRITLIYKYNKALMLKDSSRIRDKAKAEKLLKQVAETNLLAFDVKINALIHLCDLYLNEYHLNESYEVLNDITPLIIKLLDFAESSHSYLIFCETFLLQAKVALIKFDMKTARRYLTNAQKMAESHGIKRLAMQISHEHDKLLKNLKKWEDLEKSKASMSTRLELAQLSEQLEQMVIRRQINLPELLDEESILLLITSEGGAPFFSQSFVTDKSFEDHLFGGFFSAINSFVNETFSEGLDRASFGNYTLLMSSFPPFSIFYIYKGQSYSAQHRIKTFINEITNNPDLWEKLKNHYQMNRTIQARDVPSLKMLITEFFIEKRKPILNNSNNY